MRIRFRMDPAEERRETKRQKEYINMLGYVADLEYGIPRRCRGEIKRLTNRVEEAEQVIKLLTKRVEEAEQEHVTILSGQVDNLTVQVADLEKVCFE
ncbi:hypothetical protein F2Q68_00030821 [Brassica cretica]|uniref:Uncharacterized protein n=1 Tax=Brassica cretica TaxID=69181 RepID=A0A8S9GCM6_BRACR|nr:hypothetical protein F2Q68_00030821 [Brassica cretica]